MNADPHSLKPHRREHWRVEPDPQPLPPSALQSPDETRREAKRILGRDSAVIMIGIVLALLVVQFLPAITPGLVADEASGAPGAGASVRPGQSLPPGATFGPVVDPSLGIDGPGPPPAITLPPTGTFTPASTSAPAPTATPKPSRKPRATISPAPPTPAPTPDPTPEVTPEPTPPPTPEPTPDPPPTDEPTDEP